MIKQEDCKKMQKEQKEPKEQNSDEKMGAKELLKKPSIFPSTSKNTLTETSCNRYQKKNVGKLMLNHFLYFFCVSVRDCDVGATITAYLYVLPSLEAVTNLSFAENLSSGNSLWQTLPKITISRAFYGHTERS